MYSHLPSPNEDDIKHFNLIASSLRQLGFSTSTKGYVYLCHAIFFAVHEEKLRYCVHSEIFPKIAQLFSSKTINIEKACRNAIDGAYLSGGFKQINELFGFNYLRPYEKPPLGNFISTMTEKCLILISESKRTHHSILKSCAGFAISFFKTISPLHISFGTAADCTKLSSPICVEEV